MDSEIEEIIEFLFREGDGLYNKYKREVLERLIEMHLEYGTCLIVKDLEGIIAIARWNWIGKITVIVLDLVVKKEYRKLHFLRELVALGVSRNPSCKFIGFRRGTKYPQRELHFYNVDKWLKRGVEKDV